MEKKATILRIERTSISDGEGMRTVVFFKGCPLRCRWCSTPESHNPNREAYLRAERCTGCGRCVAVCGHGALKISEITGKVERDNAKCTGCLICANACMYGAMRIYGSEMTISRLMHEIEKDEVFYFHSGGGVTLSGGDVLMWTDFAEELLRQCQDCAIDASAELDMFGPWENIRRIVPLLSHFFADIKHMDDEKHRIWTGKGNADILKNISRADKICAPGAIRIRVPLLCGINDDEENLIKTAQFCSGLNNISALELLPYHRLGTHAYRQLFRQYELEDMPRMEREEALKKAEVLKGFERRFKLLVDGEEL